MKDGISATAITVDAFNALLRRGLPQAARAGIHARAVGDGVVTLALPMMDEFLRPGGTVSGPALFALADVALYAAVVSRLGPLDGLVTSTMSITFLRRPAPRTVLADARLIRLGSRLAYGEVTLYSEGEGDPVAHVTGTYSVPPSSSVSPSSAQMASAQTASGVDGRADELG